MHRSARVWRLEMFASRRRRRWTSFSDLLTNDHPRNPLTFYIICIYSCPLLPPCLPASTLTIIIISSSISGGGLGSEQERYNNANCKFSTSYRRILFPVCARLVNGQSIIPSVYSIPLADVGVRPAVLLHLLHSMALLIASPLTNCYRSLHSDSHRSIPCPFSSTSHPPNRSYG